MKNYGALKKYNKKQKVVPVRVSAENDAPKNIFIKIFFNFITQKNFFLCKAQISMASNWFGHYNKTSPDKLVT